MKKFLLTYIIAIEIEEIYIVTSIKKREHKTPQNSPAEKDKLYSIW